MGQESWRCVNQPLKCGYWQISGLLSGDVDADTAPQGFQVTQLPSKTGAWSLTDSIIAPAHSRHPNVFFFFFSPPPQYHQNTMIIKRQLQVSLWDISLFFTCALSNLRLYSIREQHFSTIVCWTACKNVKILLSLAFAGHSCTAPTLKNLTAPHLVSGCGYTCILMQILRPDHKDWIVQDHISVRPNFSLKLPILNLSHTYFFEYIATLVLTQYSSTAL